MFGNQKKTKRYSLIMNQTMITIFAKKTCRDAEFHPRIVGCLPLEISRFTKFLLDRGVTITATLSTTHYRRSSLVQGGLEIPCVVNAKLSVQRKIKKSLLSIWKWFKLIIQNRHLMKMLSFLGSFLAMSANEDASTANCKDCTKCPNKGGKTNH